MRLKRSKIPFLALCLLLQGCPPDPVDIGLAGISTDVVGKDLIGSFEDTGDRLLANAGQTGNALEARSGEEIHVATQNLQIALGADADKAVGQLGLDEQRLVVSVNDLVNSVKSVGTRATTVEELANLDLIELTNRIHLLTKHVPYYISSVDGLTAVPGEGDHIVTITGLGFGYDDAQNFYKVGASIGGNALDPATFSRPQAHILAIRIPAAMLKPHYSDNSLVTVPFELTSTITSASWPHHSSTYSTKFGIILLPKTVATVEVTEEIASTALDGNNQVHDLATEVPKSSPDHPFEYHDSWRCADNQQITGCTYSCDGTGARFCYPRQNKGTPDFEISDSNHVINVFRHCDGEICQMTHHIVYQQFVTNYGTGSPNTYTINAGSPFVLQLSDQNSRHAFKLTGKTVVGGEFYMDSNSLTTDGPLKFLGAGPMGGHFQYSFTFKLP